MNPVVLAFVGDAVYTLFVRTAAATQSDGKANALNKKSASEVSAVSQAKKIDALLTILTEEELGVFKRAPPLFCRVTAAWGRTAIRWAFRAIRTSRGIPLTTYPTLRQRQATSATRGGRTISAGICLAKRITSNICATYNLAYLVP